MDRATRTSAYEKIETARKSRSVAFSDEDICVDVVSANGEWWKANRDAFAREYLRQLVHREVARTSSFRREDTAQLQLEFPEMKGAPPLVAFQGKWMPTLDLTVDQLGGFCKAHHQRFNGNPKKSENFAITDRSLKKLYDKAKKLADGDASMTVRQALAKAS